MKEHDQHEAIIALSLALLMQLFGLLFPSDGHSILLKDWLADLLEIFFGRRGSFLNLTELFNPMTRGVDFIVGLFELFYIGANSLWLVSPFITRVYGQSAAVRKLAAVLSIAATAATGFWFYLAAWRKPCLDAILIAAIAHTVGMLLIRKEEPEPDSGP